MIPRLIFRKTVHALHDRLQTIERKNTSLTEDTIVQKIQIGQLEDDLIKAKSEKDQQQLFFQAKLEVRQSLTGLE